MSVLSVRLVFGISNSLCCISVFIVYVEVVFYWNVGLCLILSMCLSYVLSYLVWVVVVVVLSFISVLSVIVVLVISLV